MTLYEMSNQTRELYELLESEIIDEQTYNDTIDNIGVEEKLENYCKVIRQLEAETEMVKAEKDRLATKQKTLENNITRLKNTILYYMDSKNTTKENAGVFKVSVSESKACNIIDESKIPESYLIAQAPKIDKSGMLKALKEGAEISGAELQINRNIRIK